MNFQQKEFFAKYLFNNIPLVKVDEYSSRSETAICPPTQPGYICELITITGDNKFYARIKLKGL